jgi:lipoprotein-anchoring transpeptidase ErfK/SrfK
MDLWRRLQQQLRDAAIDSKACSPDRPILYIDLVQQRLSRVAENEQSLSNFPVSTSRYGPGQREGSLQTPQGIHCIAHKIGAGELPGRVFRGREATDEICLPADYDGEHDVITSRILWLRGLEPGRNAGGEVDSETRYIYIHGTADEANIGKPASIGCVRMNNSDVIDLFELVEIGDLVIIE